MNDKIKVLFLAADPFEDRAPLRLDEEVRAIGHAIRKGVARDHIQLIPVFATRVGDLQHELMEHRPQIVHFAGHGDKAGVIYLGDEYGSPRAVDKAALARLFGIGRRSAHVVVLNGCSTLPVVEALSEVVDYTVGMNAPIHDTAAILFAAAFYGALAMGESVAHAFEHAETRLHLESSPDAEVPVIRIRPGVDAGQTLVSAPRDTPAPAAPAESLNHDTPRRDMITRIGNAEVVGETRFEVQNRESGSGDSGGMDVTIDQLKSGSLTHQVTTPPPSSNAPLRERP